MPDYGKAAWAEETARNAARQHARADLPRRCCRAATLRQIGLALYGGLMSAAAGYGLVAPLGLSELWGVVAWSVTTAVLLAGWVAIEVRRG